MLSLVGGLVGVLFGLGSPRSPSRSFAAWASPSSLATIAIALGFSVAIGVIFGVWPARQAARLDPIAALHYE